MEVETYEIEEVSSEAGQMAADHEAMELIEKLGLEGQKTLLNTDTTTRVPYRRMQKDEDFCYRMLCPKKSKLEDFKSEMIPVRVLQVAAYAKELGVFKRIEVWHPEYASVKDPVLVGVMTPEVGYGEHEYILARWAKELIPVSELLPEAFKLWRGKAKSAIHKIRAELDAYERGVDACSEHEALPEKIEFPSFYL